MPLSELDLSMSTTDNEGSPFYAGAGEQEQVTDYKSAYQEHIITIKITEEEVGVAKIQVLSSNHETPREIEVPTYKMIVSDTCTKETTVHQVTRDHLFLQKYTPKNKASLSLLGFDLLGKTTFNYTNVAFEPLKSSLEIYKTTTYRKMTENSIMYTIAQEGEERSPVYLCAGDFDKEMIRNLYEQPSYWVIDKLKGEQFTRDIKNRERFIKSIPKVEIQLLIRKKVPTDFKVDKKGRIHRIIYL